MRPRITEAIRKAAAHLRRKIPEPATPAAKPQQSWATLKPGQLLRSKGRISTTTTVYDPDTLWEVKAVNSLGVVLATGNDLLRWSKKDWREHFVRARKPRKRKEAKKK